MNMLTKLFLVLIYSILLFALFLNALLGRDPMRRREPDGDSCWILRKVQPDCMSYFSEQSVAEGYGHGGFGGLARGLLKLLGRLNSPDRSAPGEKYSAAADREQGIPDEVYTLW